ncbi:3-oxoacyl-[acyl-carrier protein] reductase [Rhizobium petrolearium]|uniref:SDR family NAD(P)-dependent oxidoreductase n=2 Tax=Neorhizobium TaxID=1525371 RepID=A0ABV0MCT7_9HYPH|nr:SDR family NAD(P)-dependent oxidoreductase [Neorhizobium petrolearium]MBP1848413.1 3-oxoacyl-[acyl-carrier protein] reductase [Neorhizobium petrolearium]MCC2614472.1 SDR family oxidoreductase [Neorhizobium petrolearium]WGI72235.1 SDR family NAD(P)-dependent oxidoreductase [Neorhizobium petrolearium]
MIKFDFKNRTAVVTGGARGIGRGVADRLLASGARVVIWDLLSPEPSQGLFASAPGDFAYVKVDVTSESAVAAAAEQALEVTSSVDILINAAGVTGPTKPMEEFTLQEWKRIIDINLDSIFLSSRAVIPAMKARNYGRIVSIASVAGKQGNPYMAAYSASKGAVLSLTKALALELAGTGVLVNCITPGLVQTDLLKEMSEEAIALSASKIPLNRLGKIEEVAAQILWIASEECSFVTGAAFDASGGRSSY